MSGTRNRNNLIITILLTIVMIVLALTVWFLLQQRSDSQPLQAAAGKEEVRPQPPAVTINEYEIKGFLEEWRIAQNNKDLNKYFSFYAADFQGVVRTSAGKTYPQDYAKWCESRGRMYKRALYVYIGVDKIAIKDISPNDGTARVEFYQTYSTDTYSDEGMKVMRLRKDDGGQLHITYEELLYSVAPAYSEEGD